jgi:hypothetical protein
VYKRQRGFAKPPFVFDLSGEYTRTYVNADDADVPGFSGNWKSIVPTGAPTLALWFPKAAI